jgi:cytochrome c
MRLSHSAPGRIFIPGPSPDNTLPHHTHGKIPIEKFPNADPFFISSLLGPSLFPNPYYIRFTITPGIMKKSLIPILSLLLTALFLITAGCTQNQPVISSPAPATPAATAITQQPTYTSNETLVAFVESAVAYAKANGKEKALAEFNNRNGSFVRGELYIYAYAFNGTTLAHPINPEDVGKLRSGANGVFVKEMGAVVRNGSGYYRFVYINPLHNNTLESKLGYGAAIDENWWLGSGVYEGPMNPTVTATPSATPA